jgi:Wzt-like putative exopolysaccharide export protein
MMYFKQQGVTIVFVSHNLQAVAGLCERSLYLQSVTRAYGPTPDVISKYVTESRRTTLQSGDEEVSVVGAELTTDRGEQVTSVEPGQRLRLRATFEANAAISGIHFGFIVWRSTDDFRVFHAHVEGEEIGFPELVPGQRVTIDFHFRAHLTRGQYHVDCNVFHNPTYRYVTRLCPAGILRVEESRTFTGIADVELRWEVVANRPATKVDASETARV